MSEIIASYQIATFTSPTDGDSPISATVVKSNDNVVKASHNSHDADPGIHLQSSTLATRPAASTAGRKWLSTDGLRAYYDTGSVWSEIAYLSLAAGGTVAAATTFSVGVTVSSGGIAVTGNSTITGTLGGISTLTATTVVAALTGNASTATALATARTIWGQSFDGSAAISGALSGATTGAFSGAVSMAGLTSANGGLRLPNAAYLSGIASGGGVKTIATISAADLLQIGDAGTLTGIDIYAGHATTKAIGITNTNAVTLSSTLAVVGDRIFTAAEHLFRADTADGADTKALYITAGGARGSGRGARVDLFGNDHATSPGLLQLYSGDAATGAVGFGTAGTERVRIASGGQVLIGTTVTTGASAGDLVLANGKAARWVNAGGTATAPGLVLNSSGRWELGGGYSSGEGIVQIRGVAPVAAGATENGSILLDTATLGRFVFYAGGNRYYVTGTAF